ncbi:MAG: class I SAM-dependent methyltransferase [Thermoplasmata archaeon]
MISRTIANCGLIVDVGCGNGSYLNPLSKKARLVIGLDRSRLLCMKVREMGYPAILADANHLPFKDCSIDVIWAAEVVEHLPSLHVFNEFERVCKRIVATLPNPRSPHFKLGPTHILRYTIRSLRKFLRDRKDWTYRIRGIGYHHVPIPKWMKWLSTRLTWLFPSLSPTIAIIGELS